MGVVQKIYDSLKKDFPEIAESWLRSSGIQLDHYSRFNGNNARNLLKKVDVLKALDPGTYFVTKLYFIIVIWTLSPLLIFFRQQIHRGILCLQ